MRSFKLAFSLLYIHAMFIIKGATSNWSTITLESRCFTFHCRNSGEGKFNHPSSQPVLGRTMPSTLTQSSPPEPPKVIWCPLLSLVPSWLMVWEQDGQKLRCHFEWSKKEAFSIDCSTVCEPTVSGRQVDKVLAPVSCRVHLFSRGESGSLAASFCIDCCHFHSRWGAYSSLKLI